MRSPVSGPRAAPAVRRGVNTPGLDTQAVHYETLPLSPRPPLRNRFTTRHVEADMMRAAAILTGLSLVLAGCTADDDDATDDAVSTRQPQPTERHTAAPSSDDWTPLADAPLSPRTESVGVWTGKEFLVVGGVSWFCPPGADCRGPNNEEILLDGAAYDPTTDTWRTVPEMPRATFYDTAHWTGQEMLVVHQPFYVDTTATPMTLPAAVTAFDPATSTWRTLEPPPDEQFTHSLWTGEQLVLWSSDDEYGEALQTLDPATGRWSSLPDDPLGPSFDRSLAWLDGRFYLAALSTDDDRQPKQFVVTSLDPETGTWTDPAPTPVTFWSQEWWAFDGHFVNASQVASGPPAPDSVAGALDPSTGRWVEVAQVGSHAELQAGCQLPMIGPAGDWLSPGRSVLVSVEPAAAVTVPPCPGLLEPSVGVWTGHEFLVWGGLADPGVRNSNSGLRWTPPSP